MEHCWDFYKPISVTTEYPIVDGHFSIYCYLKSLDICYKRYKEKFKKKVFFFFLYFELFHFFEVWLFIKFNKRY